MGAALFHVRLADEWNEFPTRCSEVGTHYASTEGNRVMQAFVGGLISDEYDMEGTAETTEQFSDFFIRPKDLDEPFSEN